MGGADERRSGRVRELGEERADRERVGGVEPRRRLVGEHHERPHAATARATAARSRWPAESSSTAAARRAPPARRPQAPPPPAPPPRSRDHRGGRAPGSTFSRAPRNGTRPGCWPTKPTRARSAARARHGPALRRVDRADDHGRRARQVEAGEQVQQRRLPEPDGPVTATRRPGGERRRRARRAASCHRSRGRGRAPRRALVLFQHKRSPLRAAERAEAELVFPGIAKSPFPSGAVTSSSRLRRRTVAARDPMPAAPQQLLGGTRSQPPRPTTASSSPASTRRSSLTRPSRMCTTRSAISADAGVVAHDDGRAAVPSRRARRPAS